MIYHSVMSLIIAIVLIMPSLVQFYVESMNFLSIQWNLTPSIKLKTNHLTFYTAFIKFHVRHTELANDIAFSATQN
jgi:hypothetical protein